MFKINKIGPNSPFGPVKAPKFSWCLRYGMQTSRNLLVLRHWLISRTSKTPVYNHVWYQQNQAKIYRWSDESLKVSVVSWVWCTMNHKEQHSALGLVIYIPQYRNNNKKHDSHVWWANSMQNINQSSSSNTVLDLAWQGLSHWKKLLHLSLAKSLHGLIWDMRKENGSDSPQAMLQLVIDLGVVSQTVYERIIEILRILCSNFVIFESGNNFAHSMTAELSWNVQHCYLIWSFITWAKWFFCHEFWIVSS